MGGVDQLRIIANTGVCNDNTCGVRRFFTIDLGSAVVDLDQHGVAEAIEAVPARRGAVNAFAQDATSTAVKVFIFEARHDGSTTQNAK